MSTVKTRKKLIEVALPLEAINVASAHEKMPGIGAHPRGLHLYWARRPLATARAVIFSQMVDDPSANPDLFPTEQKQNKERQRLFRIIENLVKWENTTNETILQSARDEILASWRRACADNADHPNAEELFNRNKLPAFHDPFAGGGALPLEAKRLGLESFAADLNPVAVMINKAMIEIPPRFSGMPPMNPDYQAKSSQEKILDRRVGAQGLAEDVKFYGKWIRDEAEKRIGKNYPKVKVTSSMASERPDLIDFIGQELTVIAWLWARTVKSPNPAFSQIDVPLISTYMLSTAPGKEAFIKPIIENGGYSFTVKIGKPPNAEEAKAGTKMSQGSFKCIMSGVPFRYTYIDDEANAGRMGARMMAIVAEGKRGRVYLPPTPEHELAAEVAAPPWKPDAPSRGTWASNAQGRRYGFNTFGDYFTKRQLTALVTLSDLVGEVRFKIMSDGHVTGGFDEKDARSFAGGGGGLEAYADALSVYLAFAVDRCADFGNTCTRWVPGNQKVMNLFAKQAVAMAWDYPEAAVLQDVVGGFNPAIDFIAKCICVLPSGVPGVALQVDATQSDIAAGKVVSSDPPYYDNIGYADLSDFFYVWMSRSLQKIFPEVFTTLAVPKDAELVATAHRHGSKANAEKFFLNGMTLAMQRMAEQANPVYPVTLYYAFKQSEGSGDDTVNTGWDTFLEAVITAGFCVNGTWPMRSEQEHRMIGIGANALASSIVLVCRKRSSVMSSLSRRDFIVKLKDEIPKALAHLQAGNIAPVDLAQASIGPGMAIYTRYAHIIDASGARLSVREALGLVNQVLDEQLSEQEGNWDADTRWGVAWFDQNGFTSSEFGSAELLARAKNTSVTGLVQAGFVQSAAGKVRLLKSDELPGDWAPESDTRLTVWEMLHHLIRLQKQGEAPAAAMLARLGDKADAAKELAYRLYGICEKKKRSTEAQLYNELIVIWPDLVARSKEAPAPAGRPGELNLDN